MDWVKPLLEAIKLKIWIVCALAIVAAFLLFGPVSWIKRVGVKGFRDAYLHWIGLAFLLSVCISIVWVFSADGWIGKRVRWRTGRLRMQRYLHTLSEEEQVVLRGYIFDQTKTCILGYNDGVVRGLEASHVITRASPLVTYDRRTSGHMSSPYNIQPWAWEYLNAHPELLE